MSVTLCEGVAVETLKEIREWNNGELEVIRPKVEEAKSACMTANKSDGMFPADQFKAYQELRDHEFFLLGSNYTLNYLINGGNE